MTLDKGPFFHVVYVSVFDGIPQISWSVFNTLDEAYVGAASVLKHAQFPLGYFIGWNELDGGQAIVETFLPSGGPERFSMEYVDSRFEMFFDGIRCT